MNANAWDNKTGESRSQGRNGMPVQRQARLWLEAAETAERRLEARSLGFVVAVAIMLLISEPVEYDGCDAEHASFVAFAMGRRHELCMTPRNC